MTEQEIIEGCLRKDRLAFKAFVDNYSAYLFTICFRYMGSKEVAKDALQESLVQVISKIDRYNHQGKFKAWISAVTVKKCLDLLRKEKRHQYSNYEDGPEPYVEEVSSLRLEQQDVIKFIERIPERYRIAINLYLVEGYSHKEIADQMNITESSSRSLVSRGRKMIVDAFRTNSKAEQGQVQSSYEQVSMPKLKII